MGLLDGFFGPQQPTTADGLLGTMNTGLVNNSNALLGMGMGMVSGNRANAWGNALQGYIMGSMTDYKRAQDRKEEAERKEKQQRERAFTESLAKLHPDMAEALRLGDTQTATQLLRLKMEQDAAKRAQANADRAYGLDRERLDITKSAAERAANQPREVGNALVAPDPANPGQYKELYRAPGGNDMATAIRTREQEAARLGLKPDSPGYQSYVLTGKMPREDAQPLTATDKKAILEADDSVSAAKAGLTSIAEAKKLYDKTNTGWFAGSRAALSNNLPDWAVPNFVSSPESGEATTNYENIILGQTLANLKATFGAAPTEGERAILRDLEASVGKPVAVRKEILDRAERVLQTRLKFNEDRAKGLRGGDYYKPAATPEENRDLGAVTGGAPTRNPAGTGPKMLPPVINDPQLKAIEDELRRRNRLP